MPKISHKGLAHVAAGFYVDYPPLSIMYFYILPHTGWSLYFDICYSQNWILTNSFVDATFIVTDLLGLMTYQDYMRERLFIPELPVKVLTLS